MQLIPVKIEALCSSFLLIAITIVLSSCSSGWQWFGTETSGKNEQKVSDNKPDSSGLATSTQQAPPNALKNQPTKRSLKRASPLNRAVPKKSYQLSRRGYYLLHPDVFLLVRADDEQFGRQLHSALASEFSRVERVNLVQEPVVRSGFMVSANDDKSRGVVSILVSDIGSGKPFDKFLVEFSRTSDGVSLRTPEALESALREVAVSLAGDA